MGILAVAVSLVFADLSSATSVGDYPAGAAANGIGGTRHNLGDYGFAITTDATTEICVFCHAPHHGNPNEGPLWNRSHMIWNFTAYGDTIAGTTVSTPGGATLACLSCHDGVTTFDTLINAPGKGNGGSNNKIATDQGWEFRMPGSAGSYVKGTGLDHFDTASPGTCQASSCHPSGNKNGPTRLNIGSGYSTDFDNPTGSSVDLTDDHPVSVPYNAGRGSLRPTSTALSTVDLLAGLNSSAATGYDGNLAQNRWAVKGVISNSAVIGDLLRGGKVECSSCHDPHFKNRSWDEVEAFWDTDPSITYCTGEDCTDGNFLRRVGGNTGSGVCRTCHDK